MLELLVLETVGQSDSVTGLDGLSAGHIPSQKKAFPDPSVCLDLSQDRLPEIPFAHRQSHKADVLTPKSERRRSPWQWIHSEKTQQDADIDHHIQAGSVLGHNIYVTSSWHPYPDPSPTPSWETFGPIRKASVAGRWDESKEVLVLANSEAENATGVDDAACHMSHHRRWRSPKESQAFFDPISLRTRRAVAASLRAEYWLPEETGMRLRAERDHVIEAITGPNKPPQRQSKEPTEAERDRKLRSYWLGRRCSCNGSHMSALLLLRCSRRSLVGACVGVTYLSVSTTSRSSDWPAGPQNNSIGTLSRWKRSIVGKLEMEEHRGLVTLLCDLRNGCKKLETESKKLGPVQR
ncbi:hypothetical protein SISSUDRAFT_1103802 [Sistotremastrum suecicum HHB10207 ss-3]|uniref:Uncharacterized protein n=1 Tax=Sistotremastrum suecicum HHB10207 ss-3 TaxID=1314776 RepID=A0A166D6S0_9AGAM|nr:hypothetical protein SISSUDRAFT_1103802 [Sistotremastrum suecicum HHB10207 ss-3]